MRSLIPFRRPWYWHWHWLRKERFLEISRRLSGIRAGNTKYNEDPNGKSFLFALKNFVFFTEKRFGLLSVHAPSPVILLMVRHLAIIHSKSRIGAMLTATAISSYDFLLPMMGWLLELDCCGARSGWECWRSKSSGCDLVTQKPNVQKSDSFATDCLFTRMERYSSIDQTKQVSSK
jgi:hypothetical protein